MGDSQRADSRSQRQQVCWYVCVQCDDHVCTGGGHLGRPQRAEELLLHTHSCLHYFLYYAYIMSCICTKGQPLHIIISDETNLHS